MMPVSDVSRRRAEPQLEICVDSAESALAAEQGGAQRVELCSAIGLGGLTPSLGLVRAVRDRLAIGLHVMIRPREGDFLYTPEEIDAMRRDIALAREAGAEGVVLGVLTADGTIDVEQTRGLVEAALPMEVTFHRAFDLARDLTESLEAVIRTGACRVLSSGAASTATLGRDRLEELVRQAGNRLRVMVGGGVRAANVAELAQATGALEFHAALRRAVQSRARYRPQGIHLGDPGVDDFARTHVIAEDVRALRRALEAGMARESTQEQDAACARTGRSRA